MLVAPPFVLSEAEADMIVARTEHALDRTAEKLGIS